MSYPVAIFDVDGTLLHGNVWQGILRHPQLNRWKLGWLYARIAPRYILHQLHLLSYSRYMHGWLHGIARLLKNWQQPEIEALTEWLITEACPPRPAAMSLLEEKRAEGSKIILLSSCFVPIMEILAQKWGADGFVCTPMERKFGVVTGRVKGKVCVGPRRLVWVRDYLHKHYPGVELDHCLVVVDSYEDAALLASAGKPIAAYPDHELRAAAKEQNWQVIE